MYELDPSLTHHLERTYKNPLAVLGLGLVFLFIALETWLLTWVLPDVSVGLRVLVWSLALLATTFSCRWLLRRTRLYFRDWLYGFPMFASSTPLRAKDYGLAVIVVLAVYLVGVRLLPTQWSSMPIYCGFGLMLFFGFYALRAQDWRWVWLGLLALAAGVSLHQAGGEMHQVIGTLFAAIGVTVTFLGVLDIWRYKRKLCQIGGSDV